MDRKVYILRGPSGSGKTTWTEKLADELAGDTDDTDVQITVCSADHFFEARGRENPDDPKSPIVTRYDFDVKRLPEAHSKCFNSFLRAVKNGDPAIVVDNTNERRWEYENYELVARMSGYQVEIVEFVAETAEQIRACARRNRHGVPLAVIATKAVSMEPDVRATKVPVEV